MCISVLVVYSGGESGVVYRGRQWKRQERHRRIPMMKGFEEGEREECNCSQESEVAPMQSSM